MEAARSTQYNRLGYLRQSLPFLRGLALQYGMTNGTPGLPQKSSLIWIASKQVYTLNVAEIKGNKIRNHRI